MSFRYHVCADSQREAAVEHMELSSVMIWGGGMGAREVPEGGGICTHVAASLHLQKKSNATLQKATVPQ